MKYNIYGIGNALVDAEFEVSEAFLADNGIEKGVMTLIDDERQQALISNLETKVGMKKRTGGGSGANTIVAASQFGTKTFYACKVAKDEMGQFYHQDLQEAGVRTRLDELNAEGVTGQCLVMITDDAERTMNTFLGITADFSTSETHFDELKQSDWLYIEGYLVTSDTSRQAVMEARKIAREQGIKIALTFSDPAMAMYFRDGLHEMIDDGLDILFCNEEEILAYTEQNDLDTAIAQMQPLVKKIVITRGSEGALVVDGDQRTDIAPYPTKAIDTNGAGDMFSGAFMYGVTQGMSDAQAGKLASMASSRVVSVFGTRLSADEHRAMLAEI